MSNVVLLTVDSLRADHLGCFGYDRDTSPVIDDLASGGLSFDAYANSTWTRASFPSIITSTYPLEYGGFEYLSENRTTVGSAVSAGGHRTAALHSNLWLSAEYGYDRGFDYFYDSKTDPSPLSRLRAWVKLHLDHDGLVYRTLQWLYDTTEEKAGMDVGSTYRDAETITDEAIDWLRGLDGNGGGKRNGGGGGDIFCWVHYMDAHHPYVPHEGAATDLGLSFDFGERGAIRRRRKMLEEPGELTDEEFETLGDLYDTEIRYTDAQIGRLLEAVEATVGMDDTAVVVTSDHGEEFLEHGGFSHNPSFYDEVLHVPLVVDGADRVGASDATGHRPEELELLDVAPTVCDLAGVEVPEGYRGRSALDAVGSGEDAAVFSETWRDEDYKLSLRADRAKLIWNRETGEREFYDLERDPGETENLVDDDRADEYEDRIREHLVELRETNEDLPEREMDAETEERLRDLGYLE
jgi:arylsulfatase A-like enzyme